MRSKLTFILITLLAILAVPAFAAPEIMPLAAGNKWEFGCVKLQRAEVRLENRLLGSLRDAGSGKSIYEVVSVDENGGKPVWKYTESTEMVSTSSPGDDTQKTELNVANDGVWLKILSSVNEQSGENQPDKQTYEPPLMYYPNDAAVGRAWEVGSMRDDSTSTPVSAKIVGKETVTVPAGTFKDCLKIVYSGDEITGTIELWKKSFNITAGKTRGIYWVADGVGVVKELEVTTSTAEGEGPAGKKMTVEAATCVVSELKPGYVVKK